LLEHTYPTERRKGPRSQSYPDWDKGSGTSLRDRTYDEGLESKRKKKGRGKTGEALNPFKL